MYFIYALLILVGLLGIIHGRYSNRGILVEGITAYVISSLLLLAALWGITYEMLYRKARKAKHKAATNEDATE